ncbi:MAG TPA: glycosyltransferase family A protein, partial [Bradyrhizobium sp.]|nr:glycosyltransferase family A protein [Bradyrhizobium sp.]
MSGPLVTIGVPVYRGQDDLPITLECVRTQSYPNLDVLISVDAGDQESARACEPFLRSDPRFRMQVQPSRLGWAGNTDWTMRNRRGEFYIFQQHDDQVSPTYVADLVEAAVRVPNAAICFAEARSSGVRNFLSSGF